MDLISLKYWHWMVLGVLIGGLLGYAWTPGEPSNVRSGDVNDFKARVGTVGETEATKDLPRIANIVVMAPDVDPNKKLVYPMTFNRLGTNKEGKAVYQTQCLYAPMPFDGGDSIVQFLEKKNVPFSDRTGPLKFLPVGYGVAAGMIGIGLIWPTMIRLLVGAGLTQPKPPKEEKRNYATGDQDDGTVKAKPRFGFSFAGGKTDDPFAAKPVVDATTDGDVDKLFQTTGKRAEEHRAAEAEKEKKDYAGAYYPVAKPAVKKDEKK